MPGTGQLQDRRSDKGVGEGKRKGENGENALARQVKYTQLPAFGTPAFELVQLPSLRTTAIALIQMPAFSTTAISANSNTAVGVTGFCIIQSSPFLLPVL